MILFALLSKYEIDGYEAENFVGVFDSRQRAEECIASIIHMEVRNSYVHMIYRDLLLEKYKTDPVYLEKTKKVADLQHQRFDHPERVSATNAAFSRAAEFAKDCRQKAEDRINDNIPEYYNGQPVWTSVNISDFEIKEIELNKEI